MIDESQRAREGEREKERQKDKVCQLTLCGIFVLEKPEGFQW